MMSRRGHWFERDGLDYVEMTLGHGLLPSRVGVASVTSLDDESRRSVDIGPRYIRQREADAKLPKGEHAPPVMRMRFPQQEGWTYFIRSGEHGAIKIGKARDPRERLADLQTAHPEELRLLAVTLETEERMHDMFSAWRIRGEWFRPGAPLLTFIDRERARYPLP